MAQATHIRFMCAYNAVWDETLYWMRTKNSGIFFWLVQKKKNDAKMNNEIWVTCEGVVTYQGFFFWGHFLITSCSSIYKKKNDKNLFLIYGPHIELTNIYVHQIYEIHYIDDDKQNGCGLDWLGVNLVLTCCSRYSVTTIINLLLKWNYSTPHAFGLGQVIK